MAGYRVRESGAHGQLRVCHMSDTSLQLADTSASMPYRGSHMSLRDGDGVLVNRVQMEVECQGSSRALCVTISLEELHALSLRKPEQCCSKTIEDISNGRHTKILPASKFTIRSTLLVKVRCRSGSLRHLVKHGAKSVLLHVKPEYLTRKLILLHQSLYHSILCCNLKQPRTLAHMSSADF